MTADAITREAELVPQNHLMTAFFVPLTIFVTGSNIVGKPSFPAAVANHPAFTRSFNVRLVAVGMAATNGHRRLGG